MNCTINSRPFLAGGMVHSQTTFIWSVGRTTSCCNAYLRFVSVDITLCVSLMHFLCIWSLPAVRCAVVLSISAKHTRVKGEQNKKRKGVPLRQLCFVSSPQDRFIASNIDTTQSCTSPSISVSIAASVPSFTFEEYSLACRSLQGLATPLLHDSVAQP